MIESEQSSILQSINKRDSRYLSFQLVELNYAIVRDQQRRFPVSIKLCLSRFRLVSNHTCVNSRTDKCRPCRNDGLDVGSMSNCLPKSRGA